MEDSILSFKTIFSYLKKALPIILITMIVSIIIGVIILSINTFSIVNEETQAVIELTYSGADKGLDVNGGRFEKNSLKSIEKVSAAIAKVDADISPTEVRDNIIIESKYSMNIQVILENSDDPDSIIKLLEGNNLVPTQFAFRLKYNNVKGLTKEKSLTFLEELVAINRSEYLSKIEETHYVNLGIYDNTDAFSYAEFNSIMRLQADKLKIILIEYPNSDMLLSNLQFMEQTIDKLENYIIYNKAFTSEQKNQMLNAMQTDRDYYDTLAQAAQKNADAIKLIIQEYDIPVMVKPDGTIIEIDLNTDQYDKMFEQHNYYAIISNQMAARVEIIDKKITTLTGITAPDTVSENLINSITEQRKYIVAEMKTVAVNIQKVQSEAINNGCDNNGLRIVISPVNVQNMVTNARNWIISVFLMLVAGFVVGLIIYRIIESINKNRKKAVNDDNDMPNADSKVDNVDSQP